MAVAQCYRLKRHIALSNTFFPFPHGSVMLGPRTLRAHRVGHLRRGTSLYECTYVYCYIIGFASAADRSYHDLMMLTLSNLH